MHVQGAGNPRRHFAACRMLPTAMRARAAPFARPTGTLLVALLVGLCAMLVACPGGQKAKAPPPKVAPSSSLVLDVPLAEITNQFVLDKAWDGQIEDCHRYGQVAMSIAPDDLETMELMLRCANARKLLWQAEAWVRSAYAMRLASPVARYALGLVRLLRGDPGGARKILEHLGKDAPVAYYQAAIAAQIDDDAIAAERLIGLYLKATPNDPAGRLLQAEIVCSLDLQRCAAIQDTIRSTDDDETVVARRLGAGLGAGAAINRQTLERLAKDASSFGTAAFDDAYVVAALAREGGDPAVFVRSPRTGRPETGKGDLVRDARPVQRLPFVTRIHQAFVRNDLNALTLYGQMVALFPVELATYRLARRFGDKAMGLVRKEMENANQILWRVVVASTIARSDEVCALGSALPWTDRGPIATSLRARCEIANDATRGRKIADDRLNAPPYGALAVETAIEGQSNVNDGIALEGLAQKVSKVAPMSMLVPAALWAAAEHTGKNEKHVFALLTEVLQTSANDPLYARRVLHRYVAARDVDHAKLAIAQALFEAPLDAYLCGVEGVILLEEKKATPALGWLTKSCISARARREKDILDDTIPAILLAAPKSKDKPAKDAALKCVKGE
jgi:hypothetical protein